MTTIITEADIAVPFSGQPSEKPGQKFRVEARE
jgi:hypothetical protein